MQLIKYPLFPYNPSLLESAHIAAQHGVLVILLGLRLDIYERLSTQETGIKMQLLPSLKTALEQIK